MLELQEKRVRTQNYLGYLLLIQRGQRKKERKNEIMNDGKEEAGAGQLEEITNDKKNANRFRKTRKKDEG